MSHSLAKPLLIFFWNSEWSRCVNRQNKYHFPQGATNYWALCWDQHFFLSPFHLSQSSLGCAWTHDSTASSSQVQDCGHVLPLIASVLFPDCHLRFYAKHWVYEEWISSNLHSYSQATPGMLSRIHSESPWLYNVLNSSIERQESWGMRRHRSIRCCLQIGLGILPNLSSS